MGLLYASVAGYSAVSITVIGYLALTWAQAGRVPILVAAGFAMLTALILFVLRHRVTCAADPSRIFAALNLMAFGFITFACMIDGGFASPLTTLLILPMLYLAIGYRRKTVLICGTFGLGLAVLLVAVSPNPIAPSVLLLRFMTLCIGFVLAVMGSTTRDRKDAELERLRKRLETMADTDDLTGCLNQRAFMAALTQEVERSSRYGHTVSLLVIDVDHFKQVNDRYGHMMGDEVLRQLGNLLRDVARKADTAGRPGGDELSLLAPETGKQDALALAERLRARVKAHKFPGDPVTLSIGVCATTPDMEQAATLFRRADRALYLAKHRGRDRIALCDEEDNPDPEPDWARVC